MPPSLGVTLKRIRLAKGLTLRDMSARIQIPVSTLSKVEHDRLTLSFDRLNAIADRLGIEVSDLFSAAPIQRAAPSPPDPIPCRRSFERLHDTLPTVGSHNAFADLTNKRMTPTVIHLRADTVPPQASNTGEQFLFVLQGAIDVHTRYYAPTRLNIGEAMYFDSEMLLRFALPPNIPEAQLLSIRTDRHR